jgi:translation initiation factor 3 subunit C
LPVLRQKVRKYNKDFENEIKKYQEEPDPVGYSSSAAEEDDEELEAVQKTTASTPAKKPAKVKADSDSDSEWGSGSDEDSSDSDFDLEGKKMEELRRYFLK